MWTWEDINSKYAFPVSSSFGWTIGQIQFILSVLVFIQSWTVVGTEKGTDGADNDGMDAITEFFNVVWQTQTTSNQLTNILVHQKSLHYLEKTWIWLNKRCGLLSFLPCNILLNAVKAALGIVLPHIGQVERKRSQLIWILWLRYWDFLLTQRRRAANISIETDRRKKPCLKQLFSTKWVTQIYFYKRFINCYLHK